MHYFDWFQKYQYNPFNIHGDKFADYILQHSKTNQYKQGKIIPISSELSEMISSRSLAIDRDSGCILWSFKRNLSSKFSLTPASINQIFKDLQKKVVLNQIGELSDHSFRVGAALDLLNKNIPLEKIMLRGGWKSETSAMRYLQSWNDSNWLIINWLQKNWYSNLTLSLLVTHTVTLHNL